MDTSSSNKRIIQNTLMLYVRQIINVIVSLYMVRVVLNILGVEDYGVYNVIGGMVSMFSFLSGSMATASQRFFSYEIGCDEKDKLKKIFSISVEIYVILSLVVLVVAETYGLWFLNNKIVIPEGRLEAARWVYQCAVISFLMNLMTTPYMAFFTASEDMKIYANMSIVESALKLVIVFLLKLLSKDKLKLYAVLMLVVPFADFVIYMLVGRKKYPECRYSFIWDKSLFRLLMNYSGWNLFGASVGVAKNQVVSIFLNMKFGPIVNTARGIAIQVSSAVSSFASNYSTAVRPQIVKRYAANQKQDMMTLVYQSSKMTAFLMYFFILPVSIEMPTVIQLWLGQIPEYVVDFTRLVLIDVLIEAVAYPLMSAAQATGKIKLYQSVVGGIQLLNLPLAYLSISLGAPASSVYIIAIVLTVFAFIARLFVLKKLIGLSVRDYFKQAILPVLSVYFLSCIPVLFFTHIVISSNVRVLFTTFISIISSISSILLVGISKKERQQLLVKLKPIISKKQSKNHY